MNAKLSISVSIIRSSEEMAHAREIRQTVFIEEQQVPIEIEYDEFEESSIHILAKSGDLAVGTARWRQTDQGYKLERFAVSKEARRQGVGQAMVLFILDQIELGAFIYLNSQVSALDFYASLGFNATGPVFYEADIPHRKMIYQPNTN